MSVAFFYKQTKRLFFHRIIDHVKLVSSKKFESAISCHIGLYHQFDVAKMKMKFFALKHIPKNERRDDVDKLLLQRETKWIFICQFQNIKG